MQNHAIILAAGSGDRFENEIPKHLSKFCGLTVLEHTLKIFNNSELINSITIVTREKDILLVEKLSLNFPKVCRVLTGGSDRIESAFLGLNSLVCNKYDNVLIHDAARPLIKESIINDCIKKLKRYKAVNTIVDSQDTIVQVQNNIVSSFPERKITKKGQTPQGFKYYLIYDCHKKARNLNKEKYDLLTDDCGIVNKFYPNEKISYIYGDESNIKITYPQDIFLADKLMQIRTEKCLNCINKNYLKNKSVIIFGGSEGIGKEIVELSKSCGMNVLSFSRKSTKTNIGNKRDVDLAFKIALQEFKKIDFVINTAGILLKKPLNFTSKKETSEQINTNFLGCINIAKCSLKYMEKGKILFFTSSSYTMGRANYSIYSATKAAVVNFTQAIAEEFSNSKINVNCMCPSRTNTNMRTSNFGKEPADSLLSPKKVAEKTLSVLCSDITGEVIKV